MRTLNPQQKLALEELVAFYESQGRKEEAHLLTQMMQGTLDTATLDRAAAAKASPYEIDFWVQEVIGPNGCKWTASITRPWWLFGKNEHTAWSRQPGGANCPIDEMTMRALGHHHGFVEYDVTFGFPNASTLSATNEGRAPGDANSWVRFVLWGQLRNVLNPSIVY